jgi:biotin transporter BioY
LELVLFLQLEFPWAMIVFNIIALDKNLELWDLGTTLGKVFIPFIIPDLIKIAIAVILSKYLSKGLEPFISDLNE